MREFLRFEPLYQERVWGGRALQTGLGRTLPAGPVGESWEIVDRADAQSVARRGRYSGATLHEILRRDAPAVMGPGWAPGRRFPILVKWLDCRERLSLQVHPPTEVAAALGGEPKTENWYVAGSERGSHLFLGLRQGVTRESFEKALADGTVAQCVHRVPVATGDSILVDSGRLHAIDAGILILEIQQNSDTTYRVFDWGRTGLDGKPRQLHLEQALHSIRWNDFEPSPVRPSPISAVIAECPYFRIRRLILSQGEKHRFPPNEQPRLLSVVAGSVQVNGTEVKRGDNILLPYAGEFTVVATDVSILLTTDNFALPPKTGER